MPELFLPSRAFHFEGTLNTASDFLAGNRLGIMDFLVVQVGNESHKKAQNVIIRQHDSSSF